MGTHVCPWWFAYTFDNPLRSLIHRPSELFAPYVTRGMTVADIGCGFGFFSLGLASLVTRTGKVIAVDIQQKMLGKAQSRAQKAGFADIITFRQCTASDIIIGKPLDFALAFWMVHETPDKPTFFEQVRATLKPEGLLLVAEPKFHVSAEEFLQETHAAQQAGFKFTVDPGIRFSHAAVFMNPS